MNENSYDDSLPKGAKSIGFLGLAIAFGLVITYIMKSDGTGESSRIVDDGLTIVSHYASKSEDGPPSVRGTIKNDSYETYYHVQVKVIFYGSEGNTRTARAATHKIAHGRRWGFKVTAPGTSGDFRGFDYKIVEVTGDHQP